MYQTRNAKRKLNSSEEEASVSPKKSVPVIILDDDSLSSTKSSTESVSGNNTASKKDMKIENDGVAAKMTPVIKTPLLLDDPLVSYLSSATPAPNTSTSGTSLPAGTDVKVWHVQVNTPSQQTPQGSASQTGTSNASSRNQVVHVPVAGTRPTKTKISKVTKAPGRGNTATVQKSPALLQLQSVLEPEISKKEVEEEKRKDPVYMGVSAIVKPEMMSCLKTIGLGIVDLSRLTGVTCMSNKNQANVTIHGSWQAMERTYQLLTAIHEKEPGVIAKTESSAVDQPEEVRKMDLNDEERDAENSGLGSNEQLGPESKAEGKSLKQGSNDVQINTTSFQLLPAKKRPELVAAQISYVCMKCKAIVDMSSGVKKHDCNKDNGPKIDTDETRKSTGVVLEMNTEDKSKIVHITCFLCKEKFNSIPELRAHEKKAHGHIVGEFFACHICEKKFSARRYLQTHLKRHAGIKKHACEVCGWKFFERYKLTWHMETHKKVCDRKLPYKCASCQKQFYNKASWSDHMNIHNGQRPFSCTTCKASFAHRIGLKRHFLVHSQEKPFVCEICSRGFKMKAKLDAHMVQHTGIGKHKCKNCGKVFTVSSSLKRHACSYVPGDVSVDVSVDVAEGDDVVYMCGICMSTFRSMEEAESHAAMHSSSEESAQMVSVAVLNNLEDNSNSLLSVDGFEIKEIVCESSGSDGLENGQMVLQDLISRGSDGQIIETITIANAVQTSEEQLVANTLADLSSTV